MNEKIKQLAEQAGFAKEFAISGLWLSDDEELERFAELIIRECCEVLREEVEVALSAVGDVAYPERLIRKHFGVKE